MALPEDPIAFGEWLPDQPAFMNPGCILAKNVLPELRAFTQLRSLTSFADALDSACLGSLWLQASDGTVENFVGDADKLYRLVSAAWTDVSSGAYTATNWDFTKFGSLAIATNVTDGLEKFDVDSDSAFSALGGSPPAAARIATVRDFVVVGDIPSLGPNWIQWSGYNNAELWTPSAATQSDRQELFGKGGRVQRIVPGKYGVIMQEHSIQRMDYVGPRPIFRIDEVETNRGTPAPNSVAWSGGLVFYFGWDGFYVFDGVKSTPLSHNKCSDWFIKEAAASAYGSMRCAVDRINRLVIWAFKSSASAPINNRLLIYNRASKRWAYAELDSEILNEYVSVGYSLDDLDALLGDIDSGSIPVESSAFVGGSISLMAFDSTHKAAVFAGTPLTAELETREIGGDGGEIVYSKSQRPLIEDETADTVVTVRTGYRDKLGDNREYTLPKERNARTGEVNRRRKSRYQTYRAIIAGGFGKAHGVKAEKRLLKGRR